MAEASIDLNSLLNESSAPPAAEPEKAEPVDPQPETAATGSPDEPPEVEPAPVETPEPATLKALAEKAGIDLKDLYAATDSNGKTLSELADGAKGLGSLQTDRETFESEQNAFRVQKSQTEEQLQALYAAITEGKDPQAAANELTTLRNQALEREQAKLLSIVPEWRDPSTKQADVEAMVTFSAQFGLTGQDLGEIRDHRWLAMLRFNALQAQRLSTLLADAEKPRPKGVKAGKGKPSKSTGQAVDITALVNAGGGQ